MPVVLDTNVLPSLFVLQGSRYAAIRCAPETGRKSAQTDERCLGEYKRVLG